MLARSLAWKYVTWRGPEFPWETSNKSSNRCYAYESGAPKCYSKPSKKIKEVDFTNTESEEKKKSEKEYEEHSLAQALLKHN